MKLSKTDFDLGFIKAHTPLQFEIIVTNDQEDPRLYSFSLGCQSCTSVSPSGFELQPGESKGVHFTFTPASTGIAKKQATIFEKTKVTSLSTGQASITWWGNVTA